MQAGAVNIKLMADIADVQRKFDEMQRMSRQVANNIATSFSGIGAKIGAALSVGALAAWVKSSVDAMDAMNDVKERTGLATKEIAGLQVALKMSGMQAESLEGAMSKLAKNMAAGDAAFAAMGLSVKNTDGSLKSSRQMLGELADQFAGYEDGAAKAALAQELFGKSGAEMIPLLNGGSKALEEFDAMAQKLGLTMDDQTTANAAKFNDTLDLIGMGVQGVGRQVASQLLPTLSGLADQFFTAMTKGDNLKKIADALAIALKSLYVVGVGIVGAFKAVGDTLYAVGAQAIAILKGDFKGAVEAGNRWQSDMKENWTSSLDSIKDAWNASGSAGMDAMTNQAAAMRKAAPLVEDYKKQQELAAKAAEKSAEEQRKMADSGAKLYQSLTQIDSGLSGDFLEKWNSLNAAYKAGKLTVDELTDAQRLLLEQQPFMKKAAEDRAKLEKQINDEMAKTLGDAWKQVEAVDAQAKAQEMANATYGQGKSALAELTLAEMENQLAAIEATENIIPGYVQALESRIDAQKRLIKAMKDGEVLEANDKTAKKAAEEWERTANKINDSIVDALMRGFESGKDFAKNMRDTIVNMFKTMVLRPVIQAIISPVGAGVASAFGVPGAQAAGVSGSSLGMIGTIKSIYDTVVGGFAALGDKVAFAANDIGAWLVNNTTGVLNQAGSSLMSSAGAIGTAASYAGGALAGYGIGTAISGQYAAFGNKNIATVTGTAIGAVIAGPIGAAIGGAIGGLVNRAFGMGAKETQDYGLTGQFAASGANVSQYSKWYQEGGWFRSDRSGTDYASINSELGKFLSGAVGMTTSATKAYASAIGLSADAVNGFSQSINISLKGLDDAAKEKAIAAAITGFGDAMAQTAYGGTLAMFAKEGESTSITLARLGNSLMSVNQVLDTLNQSLLATSAVGADAASKLLDLVGGADAFATLTSAYYQAIYTEEERLAKTQQQLTKAFSAAFGGTALPRTLASYEALVDAQDLTTEVGRQQYAVLLQLAPAFSEVTKAAMATAEAAQKEAETKVAALRASGKSISEWLAALRISTSSPSVSMSAARTQYLQTLNLARANDQSALGSITGMADQYIAAAKNQATSGAQFAAIVAQVSAEVSSLPAVKGYQQETLELLQLIKETIGLVGDTIGAEIISLAKITVKEFEKLDTNVDGLLSYEELTKGLSGIATDEQISKLISSVDTNGDGQLSALELVNAAVDAVGDYSNGTMENTAEALKTASKQIEALVFMNNDGLMAVSKNTAASLDYLLPMRDYLRNIDASTAKTAANPVVVNQSSGGGGLLGKILSFSDFASGGVFGGQGVYNTPTPFMFDGGQLGVMGEAGPEAVMPLERMADGALGVRALPSYVYTQQGGADQSAYMAALVFEVSALRSEVTDLRAEARATAVNTGKSQRLLERVTQNGDAMQTVAVV